MGNFYELLGIAESADAMQIERAVRQARERGDIDDKQLTQARNCLIDPKLRRIHDKKFGIKTRTAPRPRSALKSDMPFWLPVTAIVLILSLSLVGMHFARKDAADKQTAYREQQQESLFNDKMQAADGTPLAPAVVDPSQPQNWQKSALSSSGISGWQYLNTAYAPHGARLQLSLAFPEGEQAHLLVASGDALSCAGECRLRLRFDPYTSFAIPMQAVGEGKVLGAPVADSLLAAFAADGEAVITLPGDENTEFVLRYRALKTD